MESVQAKFQNGECRKEENKTPLPIMLSNEEVNF